jgi:hypothetical protein
MGEHDPDGIECYGEEMIGEKSGRRCYAAGTLARKVE